MTNSKKFLKLAGILTFGVALFQAVVTSVPEWARYFGAWEAVASKIWLLYLTGYFVSLVFVIFGFYALSGVGSIKRLPLLGTGLLVIGILFTLRGLLLVAELLINADVIPSKGIIPIRELFSSAVSLIVGALYLAGTIGNWHDILKKPEYE